mgnify:CR=1 FL=1
MIDLFKKQQYPVEYSVKLEFPKSLLGGSESYTEVCYTSMEEANFKRSVLSLRSKGYTVSYTKK